MSSKTYTVTKEIIDHRHYIRKLCDRYVAGDHTVYDEIIAKSDVTKITNQLLRKFQIDRRNREDVKQILYLRFIIDVIRSYDPSKGNIEALTDMVYKHALISLINGISLYGYVMNPKRKQKGLLVLSDSYVRDNEGEFQTGIYISSEDDPYYTSEKNDKGEYIKIVNVLARVLSRFELVILLLRLEYGNIGNKVSHSIVDKVRDGAGGLLDKRDFRGYTDKEIYKMVDNAQNRVYHKMTKMGITGDKSVWDWENYDETVFKDKVMDVKDKDKVFLKRYLQRILKAMLKD